MLVFFYVDACLKGELNSHLRCTTNSGTARHEAALRNSRTSCTSVLAACNSPEANGMYGKNIGAFGKPKENILGTWSQNLWARESLQLVYDIAHLCLHSSLLGPIRPDSERHLRAEQATAHPRLAI